jgi:hypothetical protein
MIVLCQFPDFSNGFPAHIPLKKYLVNTPATPDRFDQWLTADDE